MTLSVSRRYTVRRDDMNYESERIWNEAVLAIRGTAPACACRDSGKPQKTSVTIANVRQRIEPSTSRIHVYSATSKPTCSVGHAIAQAVSRWLPTAAARSGHVGFVADKVPLGRSR
jgi:hypothetical protein